MNELTLYRCDTCNNMICMVHDSGVIPSCCGSEMERVPVNTTEGSMEKHLPVITKNSFHYKVRVGTADHPMTEAHHIEWIALQTSRGLYIESLRPADEPEASFFIEPEETVCAAYAYCNLHGLWVTLI